MQERNVRVTTVTVSDELEEEGALLVIHSPFPRELDGLLGGNDVHAVDLEDSDECKDNGDWRLSYLKTRDFVATSEVLGVGGAALSRRPHSVLVVLADEDGGKVP
jgi:hypothetical protein